MDSPSAAKPARPIILYRSWRSGHSHRVQLLLSLLALPVEIIDVDLAKGAHKSARFLALNPYGQVPVIDDNGLVVHDSNAILAYLARTYDGSWMPTDPIGQAAVQQWFSLAAGPIFNGPCAARAIKLFGAPMDYARATSIAHNLFAVLDRELGGRAFALGARPSVADIAAYSYIAVAPEGGISLEDYPHLRAWLARIEALPGFVPMVRTSLEPAAGR